MEVEESSSVVSLDTSAGSWCRQPPGSGQPGEESMRRCRHATAAVASYVFIFGGLRGSQLLDDLLVAYDPSGGEMKLGDEESEAWIEWTESAGNVGQLAAAEQEEAAALTSITAAPDLTCSEHDVDSVAGANMEGGVSTPQSPGSPAISLKPGEMSQHTPDVRLWHR